MKLVHPVFLAAKYFLESCRKAVTRGLALAVVVTFLSQLTFVGVGDVYAQGVIAPAAPNVQAAPVSAVSHQPVSHQPGLGEVFSRMLPMFVLVLMIYYFMIVKPQQLKANSQKELTGSLKKGDSVVTSAGIFGKVSSVEADSASIEVAPNVKLKVELEHIARKVDTEVSDSKRP